MWVFLGKKKGFVEILNCIDPHHAAENDNELLQSFSNTALLKSPK